MQIRNNNPLDVAGAAGEVIFILAEPVGGTVVKVLDGEPLETNHFTLTADRHLLTVSCGYGPGSGGACRLVVSGSHGGDISTFRMTQSPGEIQDSVTYTFDHI